jgi:hypothetical protein
LPGFRLSGCPSRAGGTPTLAQEPLTWFSVWAVPRKRVQRDTWVVLPRSPNIPVPKRHT